MKAKHSLLYVGLLIFTFFWANNGFAGPISWNDIDKQGAESTPLPDSVVPMPREVEAPQVTIRPALDFWGLLGRYQTAKAQIRWPFGGNTQDSVFFGALEGSLANKSTGSQLGAGLGYRKVFDANYFVGGYLMADFDSTNRNHTFVIANPGIEVIGDIWDARINGYMPITSMKHYFDGDTMIEKVAPGADGEVGYAIPGLFGLKAFAGGYFFNMNDTTNIVGYEARLEFPVKKFFILTARFYHDNVQSNTALAGIKIMLGGVPEPTCDAHAGINGRLFDSIEHDFGAFGRGTGVPVSTYIAH